MEYKIQRRYSTEGDELRYSRIDFSHDQGRTRAYFNTDSNLMHIEDVEVDREARSRGIGAAMLRAVRDLSKELGADEVTATIVSRECLQAMRHVFGSESVRVRIEGDFKPARGPEPDGFKRTSALLRYRHTNL